MTRYWVDPPYGWQYGFPKVHDSEKEELPIGEEWLVRNGMPLSYCGLGCRIWPVDEGETDDKENGST